MDQFTTKLTARIQERTHEFELLEGVYPHALKRLEGNDEEWEKEKLKIIDRIARKVNKFNLDDPATKAVYILAEIQGDCRALLAPQKIVADYEELKQELMFLRGERKRQERAYQGSKEAFDKEKARWSRAG